MRTALNQTLSPGAVIAYAGIQPTTWRNGGGVTRQLVSGKLAHAEKPEASSGDDWDWRLSIAEVESEGPFSAFVGMSRILTVIEGEGLTISIDGSERQLGRYMPLRFDGWATTSATLPAGPIKDLNLITRTGTVNGHVAIVKLSREHPQRLFGGQFGVLLEGQARLLAGDGQERPLGRYDTVVGGEESTPTISGSGFLAVVSLDLFSLNPAEA